MYLRSLQLKNYRNYPLLKLEFDDGFQFILGDNGVGKTNLLEAIYLLGLTKSFRPVGDRELINTHASHYYIKGELAIQNTQTLLLELAYQQTHSTMLSQKKQAKINGEILNPLSQFIGRLKPIVFQPSDIEIIMGPPLLRRRLMDITLCMHSIEYLQQLQHYNRILKQRNTLLKKQSKHYTIYDVPLIQLHSAILLQRLDLLAFITTRVPEILHPINPDLNGITINYKTGIKSIDQSIKTDQHTNTPVLTKEFIQNIYNTQLENGAQKDMQQGSTRFGIHRDDLIIQCDNKSIRHVASQGQARILVLSLQLAMNAYLERDTSDDSIFLLDDVLMDLDAEKRHQLMRYLTGRQVFYTSTTTEGIRDLIPHAQVIQIKKNGVVQTYTEA